LTPKHIRPIAICLFRNGDKILISDGIDPKTGGAYCRPLGGTIEFSERSEDAVAREMALPGLWGDFSLKRKRGHDQAAELAEPTKCATKCGTSTASTGDYTLRIMRISRIGRLVGMDGAPNEIRAIRVIRS
jgi:hypothetical protein